MHRRRRHQLERVSKTVLLLVEGLDDAKYFGAMLNHLDITEVQIIKLQGVSNLPTVLATLRRASGFEDVRRIGIIRDADISKNSALESVKSSLRSSGFSVSSHAKEDSISVPEVRVFIPSREDGSGMLESLICDTLSGKDVWVCVEEFIKCARSICGVKETKIDKVRVNTYLSTMESPTVSIGDAASKGYWNFDHPALQELCRFLTDLAKPNHGAPV